MVKKTKAPAAPEVSGKAPKKRGDKTPNKFSDPVGRVILKAASIAGSLAQRNNFAGLDMGEIGGKDSKSYKNAGNRIKGKLNFNLQGMPVGSVARTLAGSSDSADFKKFRSLAKAAGSDLTKGEYTSEVKDFVKAISEGGEGAGRTSRVLSTDDLDAL